MELLDIILNQVSETCKEEMEAAMKEQEAGTASEAGPSLSKFCEQEVQVVEGRVVSGRAPLPAACPLHCCCVSGSDKPAGQDAGQDAGRRGRGAGGRGAAASAGRRLGELAAVIRADGGQWCEPAQAPSNGQHHGHHGVPGAVLCGHSRPRGVPQHAAEASRH
eukprot:CAMPEP_0113936436 /NCGR_PEP_ID=MMETSP1339-20121228/3349_1 /TAXON_ID=94617 /ORGANISM="Fibrocapsa japonica" /LENGTH=162 /DNA_ID=CAMNT_0000938909 /DNA_START=71 /DNA_END=559 /DNA_ORIENTATION=- /assembly_acc=CAM_ASM_000762